MSAPIAVVILDSDIGFRRRVQGWLETAGDIQVVGEVRDERDARDQMRSWHSVVVLADLDTARDRQGVVAHLTDGFPEVRLFILHGQSDLPALLEALRRGARGHLVKEELQPEELVEAVRTVARGEAYLSPTVAGWVVDEVTRRSLAQ